MTVSGFVTLLVVLILVNSWPAHAYLDAGSGSMMLQLLLGGLAGLAVVLKLYWSRLLAFLGIRHAANEDGAEAGSRPAAPGAPEGRS